MVDDFDFSALVPSEAVWPVPPPKRVRSEVERAVKRTQDRRRRERMRTNGPVESFTPAEIAERDDWMCGLCMDPVDPARRHPDPRAPSIDHIRAIASGGTHTRDNVRLTHWGCNHERNAKSEITKQDAERIAARLIEMYPEFRGFIEAKFDPEAMARNSRERQRPEAYRERLRRRVERYERDAY
ncbi:HNH endonuclease [Streptomyces sp. NPDC001984]